MRDIADRKAMEEKLRDRDQYLDRTLRVAAAAEMASAVAHELNQPLTAASAYVQSLEMLLAKHADAGRRLYRNHAQDRSAKSSVQAVS